MPTDGKNVLSKVTYDFGVLAELLDGCDDVCAVVLLQAFFSQVGWDYH
jgi:hypothetical protein